MCAGAPTARPWTPIYSLHPPPTFAIPNVSEVPPRQTLVLPPVPKSAFGNTLIEHDSSNKYHEPSQSYAIAGKDKTTQPPILTLPVELTIMVFKRVENIGDIWSLQETCSYFRDVLETNEAGISKCMSQSINLTVTVESKANITRTLASIYPLSIYGWPGIDTPTFYWVSVLQSRSRALKEIRSLNYHAYPHIHIAHFLHHAWDCDVTHLFWSWCEIPTDEESFTFLDTLHPEVCSGLCEFYFTAVFTLSRLALELPRPPPQQTPSTLETTAPPITPLIRNLTTLDKPHSHLWDLLEESERGIGPVTTGCISILESTAAMLGPLIMRDWVENIEFSSGISKEPDTPMCWPSYDTAYAWLNTTAEDCVRLTEDYYGRTNQMFLFYGTQRHQRAPLIEKCMVELEELRKKITGG